jgi:lysyl-tRNA synthetase class 2
VDHPKPGEVIYADAEQVLCRRWNWRECDKSKMTAQTHNVVLVVEGLPPVTAADVLAATNELAGLLQQYCGATTHVALLNHTNPQLVV